MALGRGRRPRGRRRKSTIESAQQGRSGRSLSTQVRIAMQYYQTQCVPFSQQKQVHNTPFPTGILQKRILKVGLLENLYREKRHRLKKEARIGSFRSPHQKWQSDFDPHVVVLGLVALVALAVAARGTKLELPSEWRPFNTTRLP